MNLGKAQYDWDTLLVVGWREFWVLGKVFYKFIELGHTAETVYALLRTPSRNTRWIYKQPVRAVIHAKNKELFRVLDSCKTTDDYLKARNWINRSDEGFSNAGMKACAPEIRDVKTGIAKSNMAFRVNCQIAEAIKESTEKAHSTFTQGRGRAAKRK